MKRIPPHSAGGSVDCSRGYLLGVGQLLEIIFTYPLAWALLL